MTGRVAAGLLVALATLFASTGVWALMSGLFPREGTDPSAGLLVVSALLLVGIAASFLYIARGLWDARSADSAASSRIGSE